jgi:hypothetical protein
LHITTEYSEISVGQDRVMADWSLPDRDLEGSRLRNKWEALGSDVDQEIERLGASFGRVTFTMQPLDEDVQINRGLPDNKNGRQMSATMEV